jgi:hypothetical protein
VGLRLLHWKIIFGYLVFKSEAADDGSPIADLIAIEDNLPQPADS